jgi:hypothetical protein
MQHITDDDLILRYYDEAEAGDGHLAVCADCRQRYRALQTVLNAVVVPVPERSREYGAEVWCRLAPKLGVRQRHGWFNARKWLAAAALGAMVTLSFVAGRFLPITTEEVASVPTGERVLVLAVGDHLERSQAVLKELVNAEALQDKVNIGDEQFRAELLLGDNRLYRTAADANGEAGIASLLDDLERVLIELVHSPEQISAEELNILRSQVERQGLLFKLQVVESRLRHQLHQPADDAI